MQKGKTNIEALSKGAIIADARGFDKTSTSALGDTHKDSKTVDYVATILGFGLCFAWIVFCLSRPTIFGDSHILQWVYLFAGALSALLTALILYRFKYCIERVRMNVYHITAVLVALSSIIIPLTLVFSNKILLFIGFIIGGAAAGLLQTLWGKQLTKHEIRFAALVAPAASIVSGVFASFALTELYGGAYFFGYIFLPLASFGLLMFRVDRTDFEIRRFLYQIVVKKALVKAPPNENDTNNLTDVDKADGNNVKERNAFKRAEYAAVAKPFGSSIIKIMFSVLVFTLLCRMFDVLIYNYYDPLSIFGDSSLLALILVGLLFFLGVLLFPTQADLGLVYRLSLPVMVAGLAVVALFGHTQASLSTLLINSGYNFFNILVWIIFAYIVLYKGIHPIKTFGFGVSAMLAGMALGYFVGDAINSMVLDGGLQITVVATLCILGLVTIAFLIVPEDIIRRITDIASSNVLKRDDGVGRGDAEKDAFSGGSIDLVGSSIATAVDESKINGAENTIRKLDDNCKLVALDFGLTSREQEVLVLLAYGRTLAIIARDLTIAPGTARSHMEKIYRKLDVHKQQELIDLVEGYSSKNGSPQEPV